MVAIFFSGFDVSNSVTISLEMVSYQFIGEPLTNEISIPTLSVIRFHRT